MTLHPLALLDTYKIRWSRETAARDVVQNFYDEVGDFAQVAIEIDDQQKTVRVSGPSTFDVAYLRYLGATTKQAPERRTAGGFGEGFKMAALVLLRDFACEVTAGAGDWELTAFLSPMKLGRELCYDIRAVTPSHPGSWVRLANTDKALRDVFRRARDFFHHPTNPQLARPIYVDEAAGLGVYHAIDPHSGRVFYRRQQRAVVKFARGAGLTFRFDDRIDPLEGDRDRRDLRAVRPLLVELARRLPLAEVERVVHHLRMYWADGSSVLSALLQGVKGRGLAMTFPRRWVARARHAYSLEKHAELVGCHLGIAALTTIGMPSVESRFGSGATPRLPTALEAARIALTRYGYRHFTGNEPRFQYARVLDIPAAYRHPFTSSDTVALFPAAILAAPFHEGFPSALAVAAFSHKHKATNADRLTDILAGAIRDATSATAWGDLECAWAAGDLSALGDATHALGDADDVDAVERALGLDTPRDALAVAIAAPPGFPPTVAIRNYLKARARALGIAVDVVTRSVASAAQAPRNAAHGIPSIWIGRRELAPLRGPPRYAVRRYEQRNGEEGWLPDEAAVDDALRHANTGSARGRALLAQLNAQEVVYRRWARRHDPDAVKRADQRKAVREALSRLAIHGTSEVPFPFASTLAERIALALDGTPPDRWQAEAQLAVAAGQAMIMGIVLAFDRAYPELVDSDDLGCGGKHRTARWAVFEDVAASLRVGATPEQALQLAGRLVPALVAIAAAVETLPLDANCASTCAGYAIRRFLEAPEPLADKGAVGLAALERAVSLATERHEQRDADGEAPSCWDLGTALALADGPATPTNAERMATAVTRAWDEARAEGLDEVAAAERCLAVAAELTAAEEATEAERGAEREAQRRTLLAGGWPSA